MKISARAQAVPPSATMAVAARAKAMKAEGIDVVSYGAGEPDFDTPQCIKDACVRALRENRPAYTHSLGLHELREEICREYAANYGVAISPDRVLVTSGTSPAMLLAFSVLCHPEDEVIITDPH